MLLVSDQPQFRRANAGEDSLHARGVEPEHMLEQACEHRAVVGEHGIVAVLEQARLLDLDLFAEDAAAIDAAAHHPIGTAVAVIGAAVAILAEGAPELGDHDDDGVAPAGRADLFGEACKRAAKFAEAVGEIAIGSALS
jgi:hypothetical protein